jgi:acid phosphatase type 7
MRSAAALLLCALAAPAAAVVIERGPYIESVTQKMAVVRFRAEEPAATWLTFGAAPDCERFQTLFPAAKEQRLALHGLMPDTTHCYRVYLPAGESTAVYKAFEGSFRTLRDEDKPQLNFIAFGESGSGSREQAELAGLMETFRADFVLHTGNRVDTGLDADADSRYFVPYSTMLARTPFFLALGAQDYGPDARREAGRGFLKANYVPFHSVPLTGLPPHYFFVDAGKARFLFADANAFDGVKFAPPLDLGGKQYRWLDNFLGRGDKAWKIVVMNRPLYSSAADTGPDQAPVLEPLFLKHKVDLVLSGYTRNYERTKPIKDGSVSEEDGIVYVTLGGGGLPLSRKTGENEWSEKFVSDYHFAYFEMTETSLKMRVFNREAKLLDEFEIQK